MKELLELPTPISRKFLGEFLRKIDSIEYVGEYGYTDVPYYNKPGTSGNLITDRVFAPVETLVRYADTTRKNDEHIIPAGNILKWLDNCPRKTIIYFPFYSGSTLDHAYRYYKDRKGKWYKLKYLDY